MVVERARAPRRSKSRHEEEESQSGLRRLWSKMGPGITTGAADDDPSGIATYSIAGAQFGTALLWTALLTWPLMASVQSMCARIGMVTGRGLMGTLKQKIPRPILVIVAFALFAANTLPSVEAMRETGITDVRRIAALSARGARTARNGRWHVSNVKNLIDRAFL